MNVYVNVYVYKTFVERNKKNIVAYLLKAKIVKPAETAVTQQTASQTSMFPRKLDTII
jgi:hypothetical protein